MKFLNQLHEERYGEIIDKMTSRDVYHCAFAYALALDNNICDCPNRIDACFDFANDAIKPNVVDQSWVTGFDRRILNFAFHLWNSNHPASVLDLFEYVNASDVEYYFEAIRIRIGMIRTA